MTMETIGSSLPQHHVCALSGTEEVWNHTGATGNPFPWQLQGDQQDGKWYFFAVCSSLR